MAGGGRTRLDCVSETKKRIKTSNFPTLPSNLVLAAVLVSVLIGVAQEVPTNFLNAVLAVFVFVLVLLVFILVLILILIIIIILLLLLVFVLVFVFILILILLVVFGGGCLGLHRPQPRPSLGLRRKRHSHVARGGERPSCQKLP